MQIRKAMALLGIVGATWEANVFSEVRACCSLRLAKFSDTTILASQTRKDGKLVHLLGYQNAAQDLASDSKGTGNAMLLPIPAKRSTMTKNNIVDTRSAKHILDDIAKAVAKLILVPAGDNTRSLSAAAPPVTVFNYDIYTVVLAQNAELIPGALKQVPPERRPALNEKIFAAYQKWYPQWTFALCCFNNKEAKKAAPLLWWYEPNNSKELFFPALDAHTGKPPNLYEQVEVSHTLATSLINLRSDTRFKGRYFNPSRHAVPVNYRDRLPEDLANILPNAVYGWQFDGTMPNGDFMISVESIATGTPIVRRVLPPGAEGRRDLGDATSMVNK